MPETIIDLAKKVKAKYPGAYDDLTDMELGKSIKAKYPDAYGDYVDVWEPPKEETPQSSAPGRFLSGLGNELVSMFNPVNIAKTAKAGVQAYATGGQTGLADLLGTGVTSQVKSIYDQGASGDIAGASGRVAANLVPFGMSKALSAVKMKVPSYTTPTQEAAIAQGMERGVGLDVAQITQNPVAQGMKAQYSRLPFISNSIAARRLTTAQQMDAALADLASESGPFKVVNPQAAGNRLITNLKQTVEQSKAEVRSAASTLEDLAAENAKEVRVGTQTVELQPDAMSLVTGNAGPTKVQVPIMKSIEAPVKLEGLALRAKELLKEFDATIPQVQRDSSPAYAALRQIAVREAEHIPLMDALHELSSLKSGSRTSGWLRNKSQGKYSQLVKEMQKAVDEVVDGMGDEARSAFDTYNQQTVIKHEAAKLGQKAEKMGDTRFFDYLTSIDDHNVATLSDYLKKYPASKETIASGWMNRMVTQMTDKGILSWKAAKARWERLGPQTKDLLWDKQTQQDMSELFDLAKIVQDNPNPSGTAILNSLGNLGYMIMRNPAQATGYILGSREIAKILSSPGGASLLKEGMRIPMTSNNAPVITSGLMVASGLSKQEE